MSTVEQVRAFILEEFLEGESPEELTESTPLISSGILDSVATLKLITFLEERFGITVAPHEADEDNLNTIAAIAKLVQSKRGGS
jgi:acyl carrier protein